MGDLYEKKMLLYPFAIALPIPHCMFWHIPHLVLHLGI